MNYNSNENLVKITFNLKKSDWHKHTREHLWAEDLKNGKYRLRNTPFYAYGYSFLDIVKCVSEEECQIVQEIVKSEGHSTYRIFFRKDGMSSSEHAKHLKILTDLDCTYEGHGDLFAIDIPPTADIKEIYRHLCKNEDKGIWGFEEAHYGHPNKNPRLN